ncbi:sigma factor [Halobacillus sp. H74]|uniref:sigma factor n=1 Tax=Halobacillus sp. H74 TaxID=3457436 RepID=UPI003FCCB88F
MVVDEKFERIVEESERLIHYHIRKLNIIDRNGDFFAEGLYALWNAYLTHNPEKGDFSKYISWKIHNALIDQIRKDSRKQEKEEIYQEHMKQEELYLCEDTISDIYLWEQVRSLLTNNQWKWVYHFIIMDRSITQTAHLEQVSVDAVKNWGRHARRRLQGLNLEQ